MQETLLRACLDRIGHDLGNLITGHALGRLPSELRELLLEHVLRRRKTISFDQFVLFLSNTCVSSVDLQHITEFALLDKASLLHRVLPLIAHAAEIRLTSSSDFVSFPADLAVDCFPSLRAVDLRGCANVSDQAIGQLAKAIPNLERLNLANCLSLTAAALYHIGEHCPQLIDVDLTSGREILSSGLAPLARGCPALARLILDGSEVKDAQIVQLVELAPQLRTLDLSRCWDLTGASLRTISHGLPFLQSLSIAQCETMRTTLVETVSSLENLTALDLTACTQVQAASLVKIALACTRLTVLRLGSHFRLNDNVLEAFVSAKLPLRELEIPRCSYVSTAALVKLVRGVGRDVVSLDLCGTLHTTDAVLREIGSTCGNLEKLLLADCYRVSSAGLEALTKGCPRLRVLSVAHCRDVSDAAVESVAAACRSIVELELAGCSLLTDKSVLALANGLPDLLSLSLRDCKSLTDESILALARRCVRLEEVDIRGLKKVSDDAVCQLASRCTLLERLHIGGTKTRLLDASLLAVARHCPLLQQLSLSGSKTSDSTVAALAKGCNRLRILDLSECSDLTGSSIAAIALNCPELETLNLVACPRLAGESILPLQKGCRVLRRLYLSDKDTSTRCAIGQLQQARAHLVILA